VPALVIAGTHSGSGKTTVALAVMAELVRRGMKVQGFKVGPDFIDPGHHSRITGRSARNLDTYLMSPEALARSYCRASQGADVSIIEGAMGLFDGRGPLDEAGSTADLARLWDLPVVLVIDAKGFTRSVAPLVQGFTEFDPRVRIAAVVANRVGSRRHFTEYLAPSLRAMASRVAAAGYLDRDERLIVPSRHLGLLTAEEFDPGEGFLDALADAAVARLDIDLLLSLASPPRMALADVTVLVPSESPRVIVALARDPAFCFYYEDNLDLLRELGAELLPFSPLRDSALPEAAELVYLGGGYPEVFAERLESNHAMRASIARYQASGGAIYAECGGLMACCRSIRDTAGAEHSLWDLIPATVVMHKRFAALGYVRVIAGRESPLGPEGTTILGHEFHYSTLEPEAPLTYTTTLHHEGQSPQPDGIRVGGLVAGYAHLHFGWNPEAAQSLLLSARHI
jgi:cobyrinic acid a,c-diamide synthase